MNTIYKKLAIVLVTTTAITLPPAQAEIPFTQAIGVYQNTKEDKKHLSPFWGFVALHGKMLETIRFFGNYSKNIMEEPDEDGVMVRHEADVPNDKIAALIKRLFNSPDGVQFVATDYEGDPVGNLSRNLPAINAIIQILVEGKDKKSKVGQITTILDTLIPGIEEIRGVLSKIGAIKADQENEAFSKESEIVLAEFNSIIEKYKDDYAPKKLEKIALRNLSSASNSIDEEIQKRLTQKEMEIENKIRQLSVEEIKNLAHQEGIPFTNDMPKGVRNTFIKIIHSQAHIPLESLNAYTDQKLREIAAEKKVEFQETWQEKQAEDLTQKIIQRELVDNKANNIKGILKEISSEYNLEFDNSQKIAESIKILKKQLETQQKKKTVPNLSPLSLVPITIEKFEKDNSTLANLLVDAYEAQEKFANPAKMPNDYLYPENIVVTALLAFFVKVANNKTELNALPFLMDEPFKENTAFTKEQYFQNIHIVNQIVEDSKNNPEPAFLMAMGFMAFESPFSQPVNYLGSTPYQGKIFPDCGETSLRNVLAIFLSATNGGVISEKALASLQQKIKFPTNMPLENSPFSKMISYFSSHRDLTSAASVKSHAGWAEVVSDLNQGQAPTTLNEVRYGRSMNAGIKTYEIKSDVNPDIKGIVNMFNIIAKLIPDEILNQPWNANRDERLRQVSKKLDRFCELLSWGDLNLSWKNESAQNQTIDNEFVNIVFTNQGNPIFRWRFVPGHFQLDPLTTAKDDWRINFQSASENTFSNEWMASLFLNANEDKLLQDKNYGTEFPLSLIYNKDLRSTDGALKFLSFVLYKNVENKFLVQFQPLISRWIEKSIPLNDRYSLNKVSLLLYSCSNFPQIQNSLKKPEFNPIKEEINRLEILEKSDPNKVFSFGVQNCLNTGFCLNLILKRPVQWTSLNLPFASTITDVDITGLRSLTSLGLVSNLKITDAAIANLTKLTSLDLALNDIITDKGIANLPNLTTLNLRSNDTITNAGIAKLPNLTNLNLRMNTTINDKGIGNLTNLTNLNLERNNTITNAGLAKLTNLTSLNLDSNKTITDDGLAKLNKLTSLNLNSNNIITYDGLAKLPNLTSLDLKYNSKITNAGLAKLTNLTSLDISRNNIIMDYGLAYLTNLTSLDLSANDIITDYGLSELTKLTSLNLNSNNIITYAGLGNLTNLVSLDLSANHTIIDYGLAYLTNLRSLDLNENRTISDAGLAYLTNLRSLNLQNNRKITDEAIAKLREKGVVVIGR